MCTGAASRIHDTLKQSASLAAIAGEGISKSHGIRLTYDIGDASRQLPAEAYARQWELSAIQCLDENMVVKDAPHDDVGVVHQHAC